LSACQHALQVARQLLLKDALALHIHDRAKQIVAMQIDSSHNFVVIRFPFGSLLLFTRQQRFTGRKPSFAHFALNVYQYAIGEVIADQASEVSGGATPI
jgi:hypothetical protein